MFRAAVHRTLVGRPAAFRTINRPRYASSEAAEGSTKLDQSSTNCVTGFVIGFWLGFAIKDVPRNLLDKYYGKDSQKPKEVLNKENKEAKSELEDNDKRIGWKSNSVSSTLMSASSTIVDKQFEDLDWDKSLRELCGKESLNDDEWERYKDCIIKVSRELLK